MKDINGFEIGSKVRVITSNKLRYNEELKGKIGIVSLWEGNSEGHSFVHFDDYGEKDQNFAFKPEHLEVV